MMDEPLGALDAEFREHMSLELRALHDRMRATTVYVTHDQLEAMQMGDKIVVMNHGVIEQFGTPQQIYDHPATQFVAEFIGSPCMNFLGFKAPQNAGDRQIMLGKHPVPVPELQETLQDREAFLGVRPEDVILSDAAPYRGRVEAVEYLGTTQILTINVAHGDLKARIGSDRRASVGDLVGVDFNPQRLCVFDAGTGRALRTAANLGVHHG